MELSKFEIAAIKRTELNTKRFKTQQERLKAKIEQYKADILAAEEEIKTLQTTIDIWEAPIKELLEKQKQEKVVEEEKEVEQAEQVEEKSDFCIELL